MSFALVVMANLIGLAFGQSDTTRTYHLPLDQGQVNTTTESIRIQSGKTAYSLRHSWVDSGSVRVEHHDSLLNSSEYSIEEVTGTLRFRSWPADSGYVTITYRYYPVSVPQQVQWRPEPLLLPILLRDSVTTESRTDGEQDMHAAQYAGSTNLISHGSIFRELDLTTGKGLSLNSGLRMQLDGTIGTNIGVTAALTDQSTPLQPEGTTQRLEEVDRVFINLEHPNGAATFGDFSTDINVGTFGQFRRKLEGVTVSGNYKNQDAMLAGAVSKGQYRTQQFRGEEGNQGPYRLTGRDGSRDIVVLAGTETVWLNGTRLTRGATQDYTIDYSTAELTFTPQQLITGESRIVVDFQYADFQYSRSIYAGQVQSSLWNDRVQIRGMFASESDDRDNPLNPVINDAVRDSLRDSGDAIGDLRISSATPDTAGAYVQADSNGVTFFNYVGEEAGEYSIYFSRDISGKYIRTSTQSGQFYYQYNPSSNQIKYSPTIRVQAPVSRLAQTIEVTAEPNDRASVSAEFAASRFDANTFSGIGDSDNTGFAGSASGEYRILDWGERQNTRRQNGLTIYGNYQNRNRRFNPIDRANPVEFARQWNISERRISDDDIRSTVGMSVFDNRYLTGHVEWGALEQGGLRRSMRNEQRIQGRYKYLETLNFSRDYANAGNGNTRESQQGKLQVGSGWVHPFTTWNFQEFDGDTSVVLREPGGGITLMNQAGSQATVSYKNEQIAERPDSGMGRIDKSVGETINLTGQVRVGRHVNTRVNITHRQRDYSTYYEENRNRRDARFILADWSGALRDADIKLFELGYNWDALWKKEQVARQEYQYIQVEEGLGNYSYDTTFADYYPDDRGNYILRVLPSDEYEPVTGIQLGSEIRLDPKRYLSNKPTTIFHHIASKMRSVTRWRYEEQTRMNTPAFHFRWEEITNPDSGVVQQSQLLQEELYLFPNSPYYAVRYRFLHRASLNGLDVRGTESQDELEHSVRWRATAFQPWTVEVTVEQRQLSRQSYFESLRNREVRQRSFSGIFGYHPTRPHLFRTEITWENNQGAVAQQDIDVRLTELAEEYTYQISEKGRLTAELRWINVQNLTGETDLRFLPFEVAGGNHLGTSWEWRFHGDYRINEFLTFRLQYRGRDEPYRSAVYHQGSGEFRAVF
ncbi:MAG: hypothetical protein K9N57_00940 [Candidatus Marinimicrobia bacterium]|nr:hypothetical protein [Candidatus Neomarinimicrobiota bacterium]